MAEKKFYVSAEELEAKYKELASTIKVAQFYGVSKKLILNYLKRYNVKRNQRNIPEDYKERLVELAAKGYGIKDLVKELKLSASLINKYLKLFNIKIKRYHKGFIITDRGYIQLYKPNHPNANKKGYVGEHTFKVTEVLGRPLTEDECVHHIDHNKSNNDISNLKLMSKYDHKCYHSKLSRKSLIEKWRYSLNL